MRIESFLKQSPVFQLSRSTRRIEGLLNRILRDEELTFMEALVLAAIFFEKKGVKPSDLAATFHMTRGNISHCVSSLEAKALVRRRINPEDARALQIMLLPAGRKRAARVVGILDRMQSRFEGMLTSAGLESLMRELFVIESLCTGMARPTWSARPDISKG
jgi:DNA-binding MarR family transcriptional regulator